jgi:diaminopimelate decarboxylase
VNELLEKIAAEHGTPCFVYFVDEVRERIDSLRRVFGGRFQVSYAVKANPNPALLQRLRDGVDLLDISSGGELSLALRNEWPAERLSFTGPGKRDEELRAAVENRVGEHVVESVDEARSLDRMASNLPRGERQRILVRVAPKKLPRGFGVRMAGKPCQFGIDEEDIDSALEEILRLPYLDFRGFHIYSGTQCLDAAAIAANYEIFIDLFRRISVDHDQRPDKLVFGSGIGIPYHDDDEPVDLAELARRVNPALDSLRADSRFRDAVCVIETGRYLVGEAGVYVTRVLRTKRSKGVDIAICDGGMNHHLAACGHLGGMLHRNYRMFKVSSEASDGAEKTYDLVGPLCTTIDRLGHGVELPALSQGDLIAIRSSGAYGPTVSPLHFISHAPPKEILVETRDGREEVVDASGVR